MGLLKQKYLLGVATIALAIPVGAGGASAADPQLDAVLQRLEKLEKENAKLKGEISKIEAKTSKPVQVKVVPAKADPNAAPNAGNSGFVQVTFPKGVYGGTATLAEPTALKGGAPDGDDDWYIRHKPGSNLTFQTPNGEITAYGRLNVFLQDTTPGFGDFVIPANSLIATPGDRPVGNRGWLPAIGSSGSFVGVRGEQRLGDFPFKFVYQLETALAFSGTAGTRETGAQQSNVVNGGLTTGNSWAGFAGDWGSIKAGKTRAPYDNSTRSFNPFSGTLGNMGVIMGNTGGDNRDEFATLLDHSIWYESPNMNVAGGKFSFAALWSPGQNRASNSDNIAMGESDCTGGNVPVSGGFATCSDGAFQDAYSVSATYQTKISLGAAGFKDLPDEIGVLVTGAYERHSKVNRSSDILAMFQGAFPNPLFLTPDGLDPTSRSLYNRDIADEDAWKVGLQLKLPTNTVISGIFESMHRYVDADLQFQNERQRDGTWLAISQDITPEHNVSFGWGHAFHTPGDPGQHNDVTLINPKDPLLFFAPNKNSADMLTAAWFYKFRPGWTWYIDYAATINGPSAHFDMGQGGLTTDCHDGFSAPGGIGSNPHCWTGGLIQGVQTGVRWNF